MTNFQAIIGRAEMLELVESGTKVPAKIDTGAFRSSIHCTEAKEVTKDGKKVLRVTLLGHPCAPETVTSDFAEYDRVTVTNSFGQQEVRYEIDLRVKMGSKIMTSSFTLADRSKNLFPVLVGRKLLKHRFVVDVARSGLNRLQLKEHYGVTMPIDEEDIEE